MASLLHNKLKFRLGGCSLSHQVSAEGETKCWGGQKENTEGPGSFLFESSSMAPWLANHSCYGATFLGCYKEPVFRHLNVKDQELKPRQPEKSFLPFPPASLGATLYIETLIPFGSGFYNKISLPQIPRCMAAQPTTLLLFFQLSKQITLTFIHLNHILLQFCWEYVNLKIKKTKAQIRFLYLPEADRGL